MFENVYFRYSRQKNISSWTNDVARKFAENDRRCWRLKALFFAVAAVIQSYAKQFVHLQNWCQKYHIVQTNYARAFGNYSAQSFLKTNYLNNFIKIKYYIKLNILQGKNYTRLIYRHTLDSCTRNWCLCTKVAIMCTRTSDY